MARRKRAFLEDSDSSAGSQEDDFDEQGFEDEDPDARAERKLFENPYQRKKRRLSSDDDEDEGFGGRTTEKKLNFTHAPAFVTGEQKKNNQDVGLEEEDTGDEDIEQEDAENDPEQDISVDKEVPEAPPEEEDPPKGLSGLGSAARQFASAGIGSSKGGIGSSKGGIGSSKGGIGSSKGGIGSLTGGIGSSRPSFDSPRSLDPTLVEASGSASRKPQRSFLRDGTGSATSSRPGTPKLSRDEKIHFDKLQGTLGAKLMAKMGWEAGTGLGASGEGIVTPIESKLRPKASMGLAFRGFKERTAQSKAEARRRGEVVSDDEDEARPGKSRVKGKGKQQERSEAWKKPKKTKVKVEHQTYEQIIQNAGQEAQPSGVGKIYDATSGELREISIADISASWTPSTDPTRIPEVRHNLRLIVDVAKGDLNGLAREGKALEERKKWIQTEDVRLRRKVGEEAELIARLQSVHLLVDEIKEQSQPSNGDYEPSLDGLAPLIDRLAAEFAKEYELYCLDEIVIGAISPVVRGMLLSWEPLQDPTMLTDVFRRWKHSFRLSAAEPTEDTAVDVYGIRSVKPIPTTQDLSMTPYESLLWNAWLPKVRSCINNDWSPTNAAPAINLYEAWSTLLPPFIRDNILDQLIIPKVQKAVEEWRPRAEGPTLQAIVFPWLSHVGQRMEEFLGDARRKIKNLLRDWAISDDTLNDLLDWREVFGSKEWDATTLKYVLPKLGVALREDFTVNPRNQDMTVLNRVLQLRTLFRSSVFSQLLEAEFFPKWLDVLHVWLIQPKVSFEEIAQWYAFWKGVFPQDVLDLPGVANGFTRGLQLMNKAIELGPDAATKLPRPDHRPPPPQPTASATNGSRKSSYKVQRTAARTTEITFRSIVEEFAASHDLLLIPAGKVHEKSRMPLFKVSQSVDGKGGFLVFVLDDAVWAVDGDDYRAISLEDMVLRANKSR